MVPIEEETPLERNCGNNCGEYPPSQVTFVTAQIRDCCGEKTPSTKYSR